MVASYERQDEETKKAFEAFVEYRNMGMDRSLREVAKKLDKSLALIGRWSSANNWVERAAEYDKDMDRKALIEDEKKRREMVKRHANASMMFQQKVIERIRTIKPEELSPSELIRWFETSVKIERLSRGESTDISEIAHSGEVSEKHEYNIFQRVDQYSDLYKKMAERGRIQSVDDGDDS
ncbi:hypothetical protein V7124_19640 [Neobacillus niacini]|uniref:hypothetical protein n=1 Tax=Neobacillus niacini TaxID=86668 RepID=UPI002FFF5C42